MVYLSVNKNTLTTSASDLLVIQKQLEIFQSDVRRIQAALDSDIKECSGIDSSLTQVCNELSQEALALASMSTYLVNANDEYNKLDSNHIDDSSHVTTEGTDVDTFGDYTGVGAEILKIIAEYFDSFSTSDGDIIDILKDFIDSSSEYMDIFNYFNDSDLFDYAHVLNPVLDVVSLVGAENLGLKLLDSVGEAIFNDVFGQVLFFSEIGFEIGTLGNYTSAGEQWDRFLEITGYSDYYNDVGFIEGTINVLTNTNDWSTGMQVIGKNLSSFVSSTSSYIDDALNGLVSLFN